MTNRARTLPLILTLLAALLLGGCYSTERIRYRMTVEVDTPQGLRTGSSVREVTRLNPGLIAATGQSSVSVRGQAVVVDLPGRRVMYALLMGDDGDVDYPKRIPDQLMGWQRGQSVTVGPVELWPRGPVAVTNPAGTARPPLLVTFTNPRDPMSVVLVEPADLAASFGAGVALRRVTVQVTEDDVTEGIERRLNSSFWELWASYNRSAEALGTADTEYYQSMPGLLSRGDFAVGDDS